LHKLDITWTILLGAAFAALTPASLPAQSGARTSATLPVFGNVHLQYTKGGSYTPTRAQVSGQVRLTSENYDLSCETLTFVSDKPKGKAGGRPALSRATAKPAAGEQVVADVRRPLEGQTFHVLADQAVYVPEPSRPGGVRIDFTGHVKVVTNSGFLAEPSVTTTDHATILLGQGDDYPQLETGPAQITATPVQPTATPAQ